MLSLFPNPDASSGAHQAPLHPDHADQPLSAFSPAHRAETTQPGVTQEVSAELPPAIGHVVVQRDHTLPPAVGLFGDVLIARNGLFFRGSAPGIAAVVMPLSPPLSPIPGALGMLAPSLTLTTPQIPSWLLHATLEACQEEARRAHGPREVVFHFWFDEDRQLWTRFRPAQRQTYASCQPLDTGPGSSYDRALCELHSHHVLAPHFSPTDDADETALRFYAVLGTVLTAPSLRLRLGYHGHFWSLPADTLFELPAGIRDAHSFASGASSGADVHLDMGAEGEGEADTSLKAALNAADDHEGAFDQRQTAATQMVSTRDACNRLLRWLYSTDTRGDDR